jgi:hypothetical protein
MRSKLADWRACLGWCFPNVFENFFQKNLQCCAEFCTFVLKVVSRVCQHLIGFYTKNKQLIVIALESRSTNTQYVGIYITCFVIFPFSHP